jgi:hypothetical protein
MKALLIHVGADKSNWFTTQVNAPVFDDGSFEFIPIVEYIVGHNNSSGWYIRRKQEGTYVVEKHNESKKVDVWTTETRTYSFLPSINKRYGKTLANYIPFEYHHIVAHLDPDFENFTYADRTDDPRGNQIRKLEPSDYVFFVQSLAPFTQEAYSVKTVGHFGWFQKGLMAKYLIGYFRVHDTYLIMRDETGRSMFSISKNEDVTDELDSNLLIRIDQNVHSKRSEDEYFIVVGERDQSTLLARAVKLTERGFPFRPNDIGLKIYGDLCYPRGVKWVYKETCIDMLLDFAENRV